MLTRKATIDARRSLTPITITLVISFILLYLATLTADYYWDGITFALQIEKVARTERGAALLFHQNHLLYNALAYLPYSLLQASGLTVRALYLLQVANVFAGAAAVAVFFRLAERVTRSRYAAIVSSVALAVSAVWWELTTDANAYMVSILLILICADMLLSARPRWLLAGLALAGAMLIHQLASLFYPAALVAVFTNPDIEKRWPFAVKLSALAWGITVAAYALCAALLHAEKAPLAVIKWAVSNPSGVSPSANPLRGLWLLPRGNLDMIVGHSFALYRSQGGWVLKLLALAALITAIGFLIKIMSKGMMGQLLRGAFRIAPPTRERWKTVAPMLLTWVGVYIVFLLFWEPWQVLYRAFYLLPLALMLGLILSNYDHARHAWPIGAAALALTTLALFNMAFFIAPHMRATANPLVDTARHTHSIWNDKTVIYFSDRNEADTAFEYFNEQTEWRRFTAASQSSIDDEIRRAASRGGQVWLNKGAVESVDSEWLARRAHDREITLASANAPARYVELLPDQ
jgi:Dolichyl-phosphate-mannose-protein mannosyltransferase